MKICELRPGIIFEFDVDYFGQSERGTIGLENVGMVCIMNMCSPAVTNNYFQYLFIKILDVLLTRDHPYTRVYR